MTLSAFLNALEHSAKPELNLFYTEPPRFEEFDWGWCCREHALHTYLLARTFGFKAILKLGQLAIIAPDAPYQVAPDLNHAWCEIEHVSPVDLSPNFSGFHGFPQITGPIQGEGTYGKFEVCRFKDRGDFDANVACPSAFFGLRYLDSAFVQPLDEQLVKNPSVFLFSGATDSWLNTHGPRLFAAITLHLHRILVGRATPYFKLKEHDSRSAVEHLQRHEVKGALPRLLKILTAANAQ